MKLSKRSGLNLVLKASLEVSLFHFLTSCALIDSVLLPTVALAYVMHKAPYVFAVVGGRKIEHLKANIDVRPHE